MVIHSKQKQYKFAQDRSYFITGTFRSQQRGSGFEPLSAGILEQDALESNSMVSVGGLGLQSDKGLGQNEKSPTQITFLL